VVLRHYDDHLLSRRRGDVTGVGVYLGEGWFEVAWWDDSVGASAILCVDVDCNVSTTHSGHVKLLSHHQIISSAATR
jgi:hypothetical protein